MATGQKKPAVDAAGPMTCSIQWGDDVLNIEGDVVDPVIQMLKHAAVHVGLLDRHQLVESLADPDGLMKPL